MQIRKIITCVTALSLAVFLSTAMAKGGKSGKSGKSHKSDRHSEHSHRSHKSHKSDKSRRSGKSCKSRKSGRGFNACDGPADPPISTCTASEFPGDYREAESSVEAGDTYIDLVGYVCADTPALPNFNDYIPFFGSVRCDFWEPFIVDPQNLYGPWEDFQAVVIQYTCIES